ncbi:hypothetical protein K435DRAFT_782499 [Dendrothele bispora CBS 962.96]|uniref:Uncharacterized protein n=1 Tax=Dendrothele bispora (strain CBS 962.96) TaxID=1314807 RepID=A0A4S8LEK3_DENBC|nr:hypothetical protein K435DRAFT_782499 [Dendrothele bispora CBS 962.96]
MCTFSTFVHNYEALVLMKESLEVERKTGQEFVQVSYHWIQRQKTSKIKKLRVGSPKQRNSKKV